MEKIYLSPAEFAEQKKVDRSTVSRWLRDAEKRETLCAFQVMENKQLVWKIPAVSLSSCQEVKGKAIKDLIREWEYEQSNGSFTGKPLSPKTIYKNSFGVHNLFKRLGLEPSLKEFTVDNLVKSMASYNIQHNIKRDYFASKIQMQMGCVSFAKFLVKHGILEERIVDEFRAKKPKAAFQPKRHAIQSEDFKALLEFNKQNTDSRKLYDVELLRMFLMLGYFTGMRLQEMCDLKLSDVLLEQGIIYVQNGKGGKNRTLGIAKPLDKALRRYLQYRPQTRHEQLLISIEREIVPFTSGAATSRLKRLQALSGIKVHAHALRRGFGLMLLNKGVDIITIQHAYGHSEVTMTMVYIGMQGLKVAQTLRDLF
jgi:site-specific recombinase XerD